MAFGPSTDLLQTALLTLLQGRNPTPLAPAPALPQTPFPSFEPPPLPAPVAPMPALDQNLIEQLTGPRPVPPTIQQPGVLDKIAAVLSGIALGPQYGLALKEQRERPQREFQAATEAYQGRRAQAVELATRRQERQQELTQRTANEQSDREFQTWLKKTGVQDQMAIEQMRQAFDLEKQRQAERMADEKQAALEAKQVKLKAADLASKYRLAGAGTYSNELAERDLGLRDKVSTGADKWLSSHVQLEQARLNKATSGGTAGGAGDAASLERQFNALKAEFLRAEKPTQSAPYGDRALQNRIAAQFRTVMDKLAKLGYEVGFDPSGIYPYIKPPSARNQPAQQPTAQAAAPHAQNNDPFGIR